MQKEQKILVCSLAPGRRSLLQGLAWSAPVAMITTALPAVAASLPQVDLTTTARLPRESRNGVHNGLNYYQGPRSLTFRITYANLGPDPMPAGAQIRFGLPIPLIWNTAGFEILEDPSNKGLTLTGTDQMDISTPGNPTAYRHVWNFTVATPIAVGESFEIIYRVPLTGQSNAASNYYRTAVWSQINTGATGAQDVDSSNNTSRSDFAFFNRTNVG